MKLSNSQRLTSVEDLLLFRLGRLSSGAAVLVVRLCEGGCGITWRKWVVTQFHENGSLPPSALTERIQLRAQALLAELGPDLSKPNRRQGQREDGP